DTHLTVSSSAISSGSMQLTVRNTGNAAAQVQTIIITPVSIAGSASGSLPASLTGSAVFTVDGSGSLTVSNTLQAAAIVQGGAQVTSNADLTFTFTGAISLNLGLGSIQLSVITPGQSYLVTVSGANTFAGTTVVAH
ncbi:MAG: hypothetical protein OK452_06540, partial [Thaumarchaeota archaeon]|nr:hypothetical protein [Nitrososphaerota archaeon]